MEKIDLNYLKYFYYVVKCNGFTRASETLRIKQPVISRAVKLLEEQVGKKLLERQRKQVLLTPYGDNLYFYAKEIFKNVESINKLISDQDENEIKEYCFATSDSLSVELIGKVISQFHQKYPKIHLTHLTGPSKLYLKEISQGMVDFGIFFNFPELSKDLVKSRLQNCDFLYVCHTDYYAKNKSGPNDFIATKSDSKKLPLFDKYLKIYPNTKIIATSNSTISRKNMVENKLGVSVLPSFLIHQAIKKGELKQIGKERIKLPLYLVERQSSYRYKFKLELIELIKEEINKCL